MSEEPLSYWDYVKAAWRYRPRLGWLGPMPANQMALFLFAIAGLANPGFWLLGIAAEAGYLGFLSSNASFQKVVQGQRLLGRLQSWEAKVQAVLASLSGELRERYRRLLAQCTLILGGNPALAPDGLGLRDMRAGNLNQLLWLFLRLLASRDAIATSLAATDRGAIEAELDRLRERLGRVEAESTLARSLQANLEIQIKRLENLTRARQSLEVIDAELERIEGQVRLIREESAVSGGPELISSRLDAVSSTLAETSRWMDQHADFFGSLAADELDAAAASLPSLPGASSSVPPPPPPPARQKGSA